MSHASGSGGSIEFLLGQIADEFTERLQRGEQPHIEEYVQRYPQIAQVIRQVFPALQTMQDCGGQPGSRNEQAGSDEPIGGILGDFRIEREIGRGGMGVVYEAEQISLGRRVALKVLPFAAVLDPRQLQRFRNEAQAAAQLHHANIVPVYTVGCERGVYYYAMQHIEGQTLAAVIDDLRAMCRFGPREGPDVAPPISDVTASLIGEAAKVDDSEAAILSGDRPRVTDASSSLRATLSDGGSIRSRSFFHNIAGLGVQAAAALDHAHRDGVIHRDIKPSNLLLDGQGNVWITDFGLASIRRGDDRLTLPGDMLGTLRYMAPEQAQGDTGLVDHRADVYSLGATLYELVTLHPAFAGDNRHDLLHVIVEQAPQPPRRFNNAVPVDLETILLKALAKDPAERYATASQMAEDLQRFRECRPILARPPTVLERLAKWSRRHTALVGTALAALLLIAAGLAASTVLIAREQGRTAGALALARQQRGRSDANLQGALEAVDRLFTQVGQEQLTKIPLNVRRQWLADALQFYRGFLQDQSSDPEVQLETARTHRRMGDIQRMLGDYALAEQAYRKGVGLLAGQAQLPAGSAQARYELALCHRHLGLLQRERQDGDGGRPAFEQSTVILAGLAAESPRKAEYLHPLALDYLDTGQFQQAEEALRKAIALEEKAAGEQPDRPYVREALAQTSHDLGRVLQKAGRFAEAVAAYTKALDLYGASGGQGDDPRCRSQMGQLYSHFGEVLKQLHRYEDAETHLRKALEVLKQAAQESPDLISADSPRRNLAQTYAILADVLKLTDRPFDAMKVLREGVNMHAEMLQQLPQLPGPRSDFAKARAMQDELLSETSYYRFLLPGSQEEAAVMRDSVGLLKRMVEQSPAEPQYREQLARRLLGLGMAEQSAGSSVEAMALYGQAMALYESLAAEYPTVQRYREYKAICCRVTGQIHWGSARLKPAEQSYAQAVATWRTLQDDPKTRERYVEQLVADMLSLSSLAVQQGRQPEAEQILRELVQLEDQARKDFPNLTQSWFYCLTVVQSWTCLGDLLARTDRSAEAAECYSRSAGFARQFADVVRAPDRFLPQEIDSYLKLGSVLQQLGRTQEAAAAMEEAAGTSEAYVAQVPDKPSLLANRVMIRIIVAAQLWKLQQTELAEKATAKVLEAFDDLADNSKPADEPANLTWAWDRPILRPLVEALVSRGRVTDAEQLTRRAAEAQERIMGQFPKVWWCRVTAGQILLVLGGIYQNSGRFDEAIVEIRRAVERLEVAVHDFPDQGQVRADLARAYRDLAQLLLQMGRYEEGEQACRKGLATGTELWTKDSDTPQHHVVGAVTRKHLARLLWKQGKLEEAEAEIRKAMDFWREAGPEEVAPAQRSSEMSDLLDVLHVVLKQAGRTDEAAKLESQLPQVSDTQRFTAKPAMLDSTSGPD